MGHRITLICLLLCFQWGQSATAQDIWSQIKEAAEDAWNSDTRKEAWEKTKQTAQKAWDSDIRKDAWEKTKEVYSDITNSEIIDSKRYTVPLTGRKFFNVIPDEYIIGCSEDYYKTVTSASNLSTRNTEIARVKRVANRLSKAVERFYREQGMTDELKNFKWEFNLIKGDEVNAFCMPGGKIAVYEGMMSVAADDASLAVVIGHEIAHAIAKHASEQMTKGLASSAGLAAVILAIDSSDMGTASRMLSKMLASAGLTLAELKFSRENETESDRLGLIIAAMAGYNPEAAIHFWEKMKKHTSNKSDHDWFSTHPSNTNRIESIRGFLPEAKGYMGK